MKAEFFHFNQSQVVSVVASKHEKALSINTHENMVAGFKAARYVRAFVVRSFYEVSWIRKCVRNSDTKLSDVTSVAGVHAMSSPGRNNVWTYTSSALDPVFGTVVDIFDYPEISIFREFSHGPDCGGGWNNCCGWNGFWLVDPMFTSWYLTPDFYICTSTRH